MIQRTNNPRFAYDSYRRFVQMYADVVLGIKAADKSATDPLVELLERKKKTRGAQVDTDLTAEDLQELVQEYKSAIKSQIG